MSSSVLKPVVRLASLDRVVLPVSEDTLTELGWKAFVATTQSDPAVLGPLLQELCEGESVHSWKTPLSGFDLTDHAVLVETLLEIVRQQRPTTVFTYLAERNDGARVPVGFAAVSDRVNTEFTAEGFPVLARAFIRRDARGHGLYPAMVRHRIAFCRERWDRALCGIHLGSADPVVWRTVERDGLLKMRFTYLGDEDLEVVGNRHEVRDYLALTPRFIRAAVEGVQWPSKRGRAPASVRDLQEHVAGFLKSGAREIRYPELLAEVEAVHQETGWEPAPAGSPLRHLLEFCECVPIVR
jgi:GNAT superfamily N-acetyltransferase